MLENEAAATALAIVRAGGHGAEQAAQLLIEDAHDRVRRALTKSSAVAVRAWELDDCLGDTSLKVAKLLVGGVPIVKWDRAIDYMAMCTAMDYHRAAARASLYDKLEQDMLVETTRPDEAIIRAETYAILRKSVASLHEEDQQLVNMLHLNEKQHRWTQQEAAKHRKCGRSNISHVNKAILKKLRAYLEAHDVEVAAPWLA